MKYIILTVVVIAALIAVLLRFLRNVQPDSGEVKEDLKDLKKLVARFKGGFVPWSAGISANELDQILEKGQSRTGSGVFMSTSNEPIFAYAYKNYIGPGKNAVIYILSLDHEYIFRITNKGTEVTIDDEKQGLIRSNGIFYDIRNNEIAKVKRKGATSKNTIFIGEKEAAKVALPDAVAAIDALEITNLELKPEEKELVHTMTVYELVANIGEMQD